MVDRGISTCFEGWGLRILSVLLGIMAIGLFVQISGKVWIVSGSARSSQVYVWLLLPALLFGLYGLVRRKNLNFDLFYVPWILFLAWVALSTSWAVGGDTSAISLAKRGMYILLYLLAVRLLFFYREPYFRRALILAIGVVTTGALASLIYQYGFLEKSLAYRAFRIDRLGYGGYADYGWPVAAGIFHGALATWALGLALEKNISLGKFFGWLLSFAVLSLYVLLTYTRGAWIGLAICVALIAVIHNSRRSWAILSVGIVSVFAALYVWWDRLVFEVSHRKLSGRGPIWEYFYSTMPGNWFFGHGLGTPFEYKWPNQDAVSPHAHSLYLQVIYDSGLVAVGLIAIGLIVLCYKAWLVRSDPWVKLAFPALVFALIAMITDVERIFTRPGDYWTVVWLPIAVLLAVPVRRHLAGPIPLGS